MKVTVIGTGYVGLVTGACLSEMGNHVVCLDVDERKIEILNSGGIPIHEPGLEQMVSRNAAAGRLQFTTDVVAAVHHGTLQFIGVGTPPDEDGSADLQYVLAAARSIGRHMTDYKVIVDKSTVPVGTADRVRAAVHEALTERGLSMEFAVVSNPEFLKEGAAVDDFMRPDRIIVGADDERATLLMRAIYAPFSRNRDKLQLMDTRSAELTKYAANAMLATRISFMNELAHLAERVGADIELVRHGIGQRPAHRHALSLRRHRLRWLVFPQGCQSPDSRRSRHGCQSRRAGGRGSCQRGPEAGVGRQGGRPFRGGTAGTHVRSLGTGLQAQH
jgi:UDPglucose 6-dehydrogenase